MPAAVSWRPDPSNPVRRVALYVALGGFGGFLLALFLAILTVVALALQRGNYALVAFVGLLTLVGGPLSLLYLWPMLADSDQRPPLPLLPDGWRPRPAWLAVSVVTTAAVGVGVAIGVDGGVYLVGATWLAVLVALSLTGGTGRIDPDADAISVHGQHGTLSELTAVHRVDLPGVGSLFGLRYTTAVAAAPRLVFVPPDCAADAHAALAWGVAAPSDDASGDALGRLHFLVGAALCLLVAAGLWAVGARYTDSALTLAPGVGLFALLGLLFAWFAVEQ